MQRQLIGELNTQPTTHHVSLLEITSQRNHIWRWKPKTVLTPDSIFCFIISQWLGMLFYDTYAHHTPPCRRNWKKTLRSPICHSVCFTMLYNDFKSGTAWQEDLAWAQIIPLSIVWFCEMKMFFFDQKFSKKLPCGLIIHRALALFNMHSNSLARASLHGTKERHNTGTEADK